MQSSAKKIVFLFFVVFLFYSKQNITAANPNYFVTKTFIDLNTLQLSFFHNIFLINSPLWVFINFQTPIIEQDSLKEKTNRATPFKPYDDKLYVPYRFLEKNEINVLRKKYPPEGLYKYIDLDSNANTVRFRTEFDDNILSYPYDVELDEYLEIRKKQIVNNYWDSLGTSYDLSKALSGGDLARMISQATGLTIPIPPNPLSGIFGKPEININVSGEVNLRLGWRWDSQNLGTVSAFGQTQSSPVFNQDIRVNVTGGIGDKLKLGTDWNTRRQFEYDNKFKIGYEGEDDEIIKLIEVGNVSLPTPSTLIGGGQALFGARADFQFGPLYLKTIASQRRGERRFVEARGGVSKQTFSIRAYDYSKNHFFIDTVYKAIYRDYFANTTPVIPASANEHRIKRIEVWESTNQTTDGPYASWVVAYSDLEALPKGQLYPPMMKITPIKTGEIERGIFMRLDSSRYRIDYNLGTLTILNLRVDRYYAVAYRTEGATPDTSDDKYHGTLSTFVSEKDTLILKLIYRPNLLPNYKTLWSRQMKNKYSINASNVNINDTKIGIWYYNQNNDSTDVLQGAPDKLVSIMKVDQVNNSTGTPQPDGLFDLRPPFFDPQYGEITFPSLEPFREGLRDYFKKLGTPQLAEQYVYPQVYDTTYDVARRATDKDRFVISGEVTGRQTDRISLGAFNMPQGSVRVTLDGVPLREYEDYVVDYYSGTLTLRNQRASLPNANLRIEYEANDIFNISTRTLLGMRADYQLFRSRSVDAALGGTFMFYNQSALIDRVRLGEEPVSNSMFGFDAKLNWDAPFLTKILDALPFYDTKAQSSFNARGEWAMILPEPNKRRSEVTTDYNEPVVYIDDFEGAQRYISLSLSPSQWIHSSQPQDSSIAESDSARALYRGKIFWYQRFLPHVPIRDVYPKKQFIQGRANLSPLYIVFNPYERGIYNKNPDFRDTLNPEFKPDSAQTFFNNNTEKIWGGFQRLFSSFNTNFDTENIEFIEIMMNVQQYEQGKTKMFIDLGQISEDIIPNGRLDTEDGITEVSPFPNGIIDQGEDIGIDAMTNQKEKENYPWPLNLEKDPSKDDYSFSFTQEDNERVENDFRLYNNFEGNAISELGQFPDQEVLNKNNGQTIVEGNDYYSYEIDLTPNPLINKQIVGGNPDKGWFLYRIPIRSPSRKVGNPSFANIQYARVWVKGGLARIAVVDWRLLGSQWQRINNIQAGVSPDDSVLQVAFVNLEENGDAPDFYNLPPGVQPPRQIGNQAYYDDIRLNEQSLSLKVKNLRYCDERMAVRYFRPLDIFYYKTLKFFIHGDGSMPDNIVAGAIPKAYAFIRFGIDSMNYYEYRRPLLRDWQNIEINLADLTAIKQIRDSLGQYQRLTFPVPNDPLASFSIRGNPVLTKVQFFGFGIANPCQRYPNELTTTMWVNELRLLSPESRADWGALAATELKLADLGTVNANFAHTKPNFHRLEERFGNRISGTNWTVTMQGNIDKFAPKAFKEMRIPITYTHSEFLEDPEFVANSDINLNAAAETARQNALNQGLSEEQANEIANATRTRSQTLKIQDSWALTGVRLGIPINHWTIRETLNKLTFGYSYSQEFERSPVVAERFNWMWMLTAQYAATISELLAVQPLKWAKSIPILEDYSEWKFNPLPSNFSAGLNMTRRRTTEQSRFLPFPSPVLRDFSIQRQAQLSWRLSQGGILSPIIDYSVNTSSSLVPFELDENGKQRSSSELTKLILFNKGKILEFGVNNLHTQTVTINFRPKLPLGNINKFLETTGSFTTTYNWSNPMQPDPAIADIVKSANWNNSMRLNNSFRLKSLADGWFGVVDQRSTPMRIPKDTTSKGILHSIGMIFKTIFLDYEKFDFNFNQNSSSVNPGVFGGTGFDNFWARGLLGRKDELPFGPSFAYQLGLIEHPHGSFSLKPSSRFPFFRSEVNPGLRPPNAILQENFTQRTGLEIRTNRPLWEGAVLDLSWRSDLTFNKNQTVITNAQGVPNFTNVIANESFSRSSLSLPTFFGLNLFNNTIENVVNLYNEQKQVILASNVDTVTKNQLLLNALADAFRKGLEIPGFFGGDIGRYLPAVNWAIRWEGLEKWGIFQGIGARRISFEHIYTSKYIENSLIDDNGRTIQAQQIQQGFQPMIGITMAFDEKIFKGNLTATARYSSTNAFQLMSSNRSTITRQSTDEIQIQASYTLRGFEFPFFNLTIQNDLEFSFLASVKNNVRDTYDVLDYKDEKGRRLDGNTQITIEPRARYAMSNRVSASFFFRYEGTFTSGAANPGYSTTQVGLDIRISIAGGR